MDPVGLHCLIRSGSSRIQFDCTVGSDQDPVGSGWTALFDRIRIRLDCIILLDQDLAIYFMYVHDLQKLVELSL